jgi:uncharacterized membrane protein YhdT
MKKKKTRMYLAVFTLLTLMTWSPLGYGSHGPTERIFGMPDWAVIALLAAVVLFVLEWYFLFFSGLAIDDKEIDETLASLKSDQDDAMNDSVAKRKVILP